MNTPKFKTQRLILRGIKSDDLFGYSEILSDLETMRLFGGATLRNDLEIIDLVDTIRKERERNISFFWSIIPKIEKEFAGFVRLMNYESIYFDTSYQSMGDYKNSLDFSKYINRKGWEIEYVLLKKFRRNGFMTETLNAILEFASNEKLFPIYAKVNSIDNLATIKLLQKNTFLEVLPLMSKDGKLGMIYERK